MSGTIGEYLHGHLPGRCDELDEVDSTNAEALRRAAAGDRGPRWIMARRQTAGRGRSGRAWTSSEGNLHATLLLAPDCPLDRLHQLSLLTGIAVVEALLPLHAAARQDGAGPPRLKWPNDVLSGHAKLGGILIESTAVAGVTVAAIGIGVNVAAPPAVAGRATAAIADWGIEITPHDLLARIDDRMGHWLGMWQRGESFAAVRAAWLQRAGPIGEPISVNTGAETICGEFAGIDETGALLVDNVRATSGETRRFTFGDVTLGPRQSEGTR